MDNYEDKLIRTFIEVPLFSKHWKEIGLGEDELLSLQIMRLKDPISGPVIEGTGSIRKVREKCDFRWRTEGVKHEFTF